MRQCRRIELLGRRCGGKSREVLELVLAEAVLGGLGSDTGSPIGLMDIALDLAGVERDPFPSAIADRHSRRNELVFAFKDAIAPRREFAQDGLGHLLEL